MIPPVAGILKNSFRRIDLKVIYRLLKSFIGDFGKLFWESLSFRIL
jgi:hypothetical protein